MDRALRVEHTEGLGHGGHRGDGFPDAEPPASGDEPPERAARGVVGQERDRATLHRDRVTDREDVVVGPRTGDPQLPAGRRQGIRTRRGARNDDLGREGPAGGRLAHEPHLSRRSGPKVAHDVVGGSGGPAPGGAACGWVSMAHVYRRRAGCCRSYPQAGATFATLPGPGTGRRAKLVRMTLAFTRLGFAPDYVDYEAGLEAQRQLHDDVVAGSSPSTVLLLEHAAVYTAGKRTEDHERPLDGTPVVPVDRGGKLTWHGPGQLVGYPIVRLREPRGIRAYVELLEDVMITVINEYGVRAEHVDGRSGVWVRADERGGDRKIAAIGISVHDGVTGHGFAINCNNSLDPYAQIIACGITDAGTTTISAECGRDVGPRDIVDRITEELSRRQDEFVAAGIPAPEGALA